jgi:hypothetical protein
VSSLLFWQTELIAASRAFAEYVGLAILEFCFSKAKIISDSLEKPAKYCIFALPFVNVTRKTTE